MEKKFEIVITKLFELLDKGVGDQPDVDLKNPNTGLENYKAAIAIRTAAREAIAEWQALTDDAKVLIGFEIIARLDKKYPKKEK